MKPARLRSWSIIVVDPGTAPSVVAWADRGDTVRFYDREHVGGYGIGAEDQKVSGKQDKRPVTEPDVEKFRAILEYHAPHLVVVEAVWVRPNQGIVSQAKMLRCRFMIEGAVLGLGLNLLRLAPQTWQKWHGILTSDKTAHRVLATSRYPKWGWAFGRMKDHDRADAMLMAEVGQDFMDKMHTRAVARGAPWQVTPTVRTWR